jgi:hypothetical protein
MAGPDVTIPFGALVESLGTFGDREKFLFLGEPYSVRREIFVDALPPDAPDAAEATATAAPPASAQPQPHAAQAPSAQPAADAKLKFERLDAGGHAVARAKVPGGWLVTCGTGVTFYPDPKHAWDGTSLK